MLFLYYIPVLIYYHFVWIYWKISSFLLIVIYIFQSKKFLFLYWHGSDSSIWKPIFELWYKMINHYVSQFKIWNIHILSLVFVWSSTSRTYTTCLIGDQFHYLTIQILNLSNTTILCVCLQAWRVTVHGFHLRSLTWLVGNNLGPVHSADNWK